MNTTKTVVIPYFDGKNLNYQNTLKGLEVPLKETREDFHKFLERTSTKEEPN